MSDDQTAETDDTPLSLATVDQIADELARRFRHVLVAVDGPHRTEAGTSRIGWYSRGNVMGVLGLATWVRSRLCEDDDESDDDDGEDIA